MNPQNPTPDQPHDQTLPPTGPASPPPYGVPPGYPPPMPAGYGAYAPPPYGYAPPPPPPPPPPPAAVATAGRGAAPQVVQIVSKSSGFTRAILFMLALFMFGGVFAFGLFFGFFSGFSASAASGMSRLVDQPYRAGSGGKIAIIPVVGVIDGPQAEFVRGAVDKVLDDRSVKAVVLRVNSPGGGVTASDQIWYQVRRLKNSGLPVVASYGGMATSGGYYVSCHADEIVAEETCTTGSIGVIAQILTMEGLLDKVGIEAVTLVASGSPQKDVANDMMRAWNDQDRDRVVTMLDAAYSTFLQRVQDGRGAVVDSTERIRELADGSVYTAQAALENGLIDQVGYLDDAIGAAERLASLPLGRSNVVILRDPPSFFGSPWLLEGPAKTPATLDAETIRSFVSDLSAPRMMYLAN
ncbi:MAG: signal peptide peptidase SppA [Planctomycetota bacterium]|jgi:protease-4